MLDVHVTHERKHMSKPKFQVLPEGEALPPSRTDWGPVRQALLEGKTLFFADENLTSQNAKYLILMFNRSNPKRSLHARRSERFGVFGRTLWLEPL